MVYIFFSNTMRNIIFKFITNIVFIWLYMTALYMTALNTHCSMRKPSIFYDLTNSF